ncbi:Desumoylating isopeptidase-like protein [Hapsidospora chrysogenum ATCC 11550]|uniref:Desumoylating isopeptidase-like protein n=1 Tax=Hapsidospora chrysogenum (strain ATCC 11550 / CBS 779.69 / DSM 880 / IAM 14645 / JCM 23072 / IMI 49137) TaxID=857340 RepID=A0A086TC13_HAPC1|nr:Desumoylating isopeptidase-like protein [Hapsidospora chrysogenum ATCC 11550]
MDVHLLVYDLSRGMARQMSMGLLGFQLDAIYHTSILLRGREYVYDGAIISIAPGSSHLGQPMEKLHLGTTDLTMDIIEEYLDSVRSIFTLEAYDLFRHNCNNFTDSFANFLLGKGIPSHIVNMPQAAMDSPLGQLLLPQLTQGVNASRQNGSILGLQQSGRAQPQAQATSVPSGGVRNISTSSELTKVLEGARNSCAVIFFTSATCPPCKALYPTYDQLAEEFQGKSTLIKIDISQPQARAVASQFSIRATPTFVTFLKGDQENKWTGASPHSLRESIQLLVQMVSPPHPHASLKVPSFFLADAKPVLYSKIPPMTKLVAKMGDELAAKSEVRALKAYIETREFKGALDAVLPDLSSLAEFVQQMLKEMPLEMLFIIVDLFRCALVDQRISGYFAEEQAQQTVHSVIDFVNRSGNCPYALRLVTLQMACNLFSTPLFSQEILRSGGLLPPITQLISSSFLDEGHNSVRVAASSLFFNLALANRNSRGNGSKSSLPEADQVELAASLVEAIGQEEKSIEALQGMLSALGHLFYEADLNGELADLLRALDAEATIVGKKKVFPNERLITEVGSELLGKGLRKP